MTRLGRPGVSEAVSLVGRAALFGPQRLVAPPGARPHARGAHTVSILGAVRRPGSSRARYPRRATSGPARDPVSPELGRAGRRRRDRPVPPRWTGRSRVASFLASRPRRDDRESRRGDAHHSLEHAPDPRQTLTPATRLRPRGPNPGPDVDGRLEAFETDGSSWTLRAPRHITVLRARGWPRRRGAGLRIAAPVHRLNQSQLRRATSTSSAYPWPGELRLREPGEVDVSRSQIRDWRRRAAEPTAPRAATRRPAPAG